MDDIQYGYQRTKSFLDPEKGNDGQHQLYCSESWHMTRLQYCRDMRIFVI